MYALERAQSFVPVSAFPLRGGNSLCGGRSPRRVSRVVACARHGKVNVDSSRGKGTREDNAKRGNGEITHGLSQEIQAFSQVWDGVKRVISVSAVSLGVLMSGGVVVQAFSGNKSLHVATQSTQSTGKVSVGKDAAGDVEAAAMTLGAVTIGGLVMRAIISSRRDEEEEKRRLQEECERLEREEKERALRVKRKRMEQVEDKDNLVPDDELMSSFMKRVQNLDSRAEDSSDEKAKPDDGKKANMRHSPIPDRGTGSALLDRPESADDADNASGKDTADGTEAEPVNPEKLEMLKRMWDLNMPDNDERKSK